MSEEQDYIIVTLGGDSDDDNDDDLLTENSETECTENTASNDGVLPLEPNFQSGSDDSQPSSQMPNGVEGLAGLGDQLVPQMNYPENLRIYNPDSEEVEFIPLHNEETSSVSKQDNVGLQDLIENTNKQVTQLCGIISKMKNKEEEQSSLNSASPVVPTAEEPSIANTPEMMGYHRMGPDVASSSVHTPHNLEMPKIAENIQENNLEAMNCPTVPKIDNSHCSSFICHPPEGEHYIVVEVPEDEETNLEIHPGSSEDDSDLEMVVEVETTFAKNPETTNDPLCLENSSSVCCCIRPSFEMDIPQTNLQENAQMMNSPPLLGNNNNGQEMDIPQTNLQENAQMMNSPPLLGNNNNGQEMDIPQTNLQENAQMMNSPPLLGNNNNGQEMDIPQTNLQENAQMMNSPPLLGNNNNGQVGDIAQTNQEQNTQTMNNPPFSGNNRCGENIPRVLILSDVGRDKVLTNQGQNTQMMNNPPFLGNNRCGQNISHVLIFSDFEGDKVRNNREENTQTTNITHVLGNNNGVGDIPRVERDNAQTNHKENSQMMNNPQFLGNNNGGQNMPRVIILSNEGDNARNNQEINTQITSNRHVLGNNSGARDIPRVLIFCDDKGGKAQNNWEKNTQMMNNRQMLGNNSGGRDTAHVLILCNDEMNKTQFKQEENTQMMHNPGVLGNNNGGRDTPRVLIHSHGNSRTEIKSETAIYPISVKNEIKEEDIDSGSYFITPGYALLPLDIIVKADSVENSHGTMFSPIVLEIDNSHESSSSSESIPLDMGYLGDPKRKITIPRMHLVTAQRKPEPKHAARYLVRNLFSREVLLCSTASANLNLPSSSGRQPLDPNIMAAVREYLVTIFPNHDLRECGRDWRACISYVNALIRYLCSAAKKYPQKTVVLTKRSIPASVDLDDKKDVDGGEGSSLLYRQAAASETSASGNSQPKRSAVSEGFENPSTSASVLPYRALCYIGNPTRNVQVSYLVLTIAKKKACPQMAASYLIGHLFPEDVLLNSSVYGNLWHGVCALNYNRINAIREFLQDIYPACDLSEGGREWKMCVNSMNHYIRTLKPGYRNFTFESSSSSETSSSSKSESSDTDLSD